LPDFAASKLAFLQNYGVEFGEWLNNAGMTGWMDLVGVSVMVGFVLAVKNSQERSASLKNNWGYQLGTIIILASGIFSLSKISQFLYFQF
jgi:hypothetical protein